MVGGGGGGGGGGCNCHDELNFEMKRRIEGGERI